VVLFANDGHEELAQAREDNDFLHRPPSPTRQGDRGVARRETDGARDVVVAGVGDDVVVVCRAVVGAVVESAPRDGGRKPAGVRHDGEGNIRKGLGNDSARGRHRVGLESAHLEVCKRRPQSAALLDEGAYFGVAARRRTHRLDNVGCGDVGQGAKVGGAVPLFDDEAAAPLEARGKGPPV